MKQFKPTHKLEAPNIPSKPAATPAAEGPKASATKPKTPKVEEEVAPAAKTRVQKSVIVPTGKGKVNVKPLTQSATKQQAAVKTTKLEEAKKLKAAKQRDRDLERQIASDLYKLGQFHHKSVISGSNPVVKDINDGNRDLDYQTQIYLKRQKNIPESAMVNRHYSKKYGVPFILLYKEEDGKLYFESAPETTDKFHQSSLRIIIKGLNTETTIGDRITLIDDFLRVGNLGVEECETLLNTFKDIDDEEAKEIFVEMAKRFLERKLLSTGWQLWVTDKLRALAPESNDIADEPDQDEVNDDETRPSDPPPPTEEMDDDGTASESFVEEDAEAEEVDDDAVEEDDSEAN